ncbi:MAG: DNA topoisomerase, partial [Candidatus Thorarchaeota archaeon]
MLRKKVLLIGEKPSQIKKFRETLFSNFQTSKEGKMIYSYHGTWSGNHAVYEVTMLPLSGHISTLDTPEEYGWGKVNPVTIVEDPKAIQTIFNSGYYKIITRMARNTDELWIATDPDSEGDNIGWEAYTIACKANKNLQRNVRRIWNASLTTSEILRSIKIAEIGSLGWDLNLAFSVQGRRLVDAWLGFAGTRELTRSASHVQKIDVLSVGRVQIPTLKIIVDRDNEHEQFIPQNLWNLLLLVRKQEESVENNSFIAKHEKSPFSNEQDLDIILNSIKEENFAIIKEINKKKTNKSPPVPLNTTAALSLIAGIYHVKVEDALRIMSDLYLEGLISYPRTENNYFKPDFPHDKILHELKKDNVFLPFIRRINNFNQVRTNGKKKGVEDHDPIFPTGELPEDKNQKITPLHRKVWETLTRYYISLFLSDLIIFRTKIKLIVRNENFIAMGSEIIDKGWTDLTPWVQTDTNFLPPLNENEIVEIINHR